MILRKYKDDISCYLYKWGSLEELLLLKEGRRLLLISGGKEVKGYDRGIFIG